MLKDRHLHSKEKCMAQNVLKKRSKNLHKSNKLANFAEQKRNKPYKE